MPIPKKTPLKDEEIEHGEHPFSPAGDETRTVGGESVYGFIREGNDIPLEKKHTLAKYLAKQTSVNSFPITGDVYQETSATSPNGTPTFFRQPADFQSSFTNPNGKVNPFTLEPDPLNDLDTYSNSGGGVGDREAQEWLQNNLSKGKVDNPKTYNGHTLLRYTLGDKPTGDGKYTAPHSHDLVNTGFVSKVLSHNRFNPREPAGAGSRGPRMQGRFGFYDPDAPEVSPSVMSKIGPLLTLRAAGEMGAEGKGFDPPDTMSVRTILPGKSQLGISRIDSIVLEARDALQDISGGVASGARLESDIDLNTLSFGQVNTYADPFSGMLPLGMSALAISLILAAQIAVDLFASVVNMISTTSSNTSTSRDTLGRHILGKSYTNPGQESSRLSIPLPAKLLGIVRTQHKYSDAMSKGLEIFFGVDVGRTTIEPGFYVTFLRSILASAAVLVRKVGEIFGSGNPFNILNAIAGFMDSIRSSKLIAAMNVFAHLGDRALILEASNPTDPNRPSVIDDLPSGLPGSAATKSRDDSSLRLAWRNSTAPMSVLLPVSLRNAGATKDLTRKISSLNRAYAGMATLYPTNGARDNKIPRDKMKALEARLEAEYVPFYFHDMRTNEIVAFHAFLSDLTDAYTVNHDTIDAYGRVDQIKIYKSTGRQISMAFTVVATNEDDFDVMWMKINKLLTLAYPQWSEGLAKTDPEGNRFIQPFSQVPAASPVFRVRVGDVIKSNYSRFALKRIFGYGTSNFKNGNVDDSTLRSLDETSVAQHKAYRDAEAGFASVNGTLAQIDQVNVGDNYILRPAPVDGYTSTRSAGGISVGVSIGNGGSGDGRLYNRGYVRVKATSITSDGFVKVQLDTGDSYFVTAPDLIELKNGLIPAAKKQLADNSSDHTLEGKGGFFDGGTGEGPDVNSNTIVRSFEMAMSKGLACVLNSINFNWLESTTWETEIFGSKAPKMCRISLSLTPFHDITPGIDAYGFNRAPIYNVGQYANLLGDDDPNGENQFEVLRDSLWRKR